MSTNNENSNNEYDSEKDDKFSSSVEGSRQEYVCVSPHTLLNTPPTFDNKQDYKGDTHNETPDHHWIKLIQKM